MPDPTVTTRDRELAIKALHNSPLDKMNPRDFVVLWEQVEAVVMEARREGQEELSRALNEWMDQQLEGLRRSSMPEVSRGAWNAFKAVASKLSALLDQPALSGAEE